MSYRGNFFMIHLLLRNAKLDGKKDVPISFDNYQRNSKIKIGDEIFRICKIVEFNAKSGHDAGLSSSACIYSNKKKYTTPVLKALPCRRRRIAKKRVGLSKSAVALILRHDRKKRRQQSYYLTLESGEMIHIKSNHSSLSLNRDADEDLALLEPIIEEEEEEEDDYF